MTDPVFKIDDLVWKHGTYSGLGTVRGVTSLPDGTWRYLVGHKIEGGRGEFLHVYTIHNIRRLLHGEAP